VLPAPSLYLRLAEQLRRKIFHLVRIFKKLERTLSVKAARIEWNCKQNVQFVHNLVKTIL